MIPKYFNNVNLGITSKCNAKCDYCNRKTFADFPDMNQDMPLSTFEKILPFTKKIEFCGSYGDFINHPNSLEFAEITKSKKIPFNIETNAAVRNKEYWQSLAKICNSENAYVQFSIDDILNTINPYRKVNTSNVLENLETFILAGGYAEVKTILFNFNENQMNSMKTLFDNMGVRKHLKQYSMIYEKNELAAPKDCKYKKGTLPFLYDISSKLKNKPKVCQWNAGKWIYILDNGEVHPCCNIVTYGGMLKDTMPFVSEYTNIEEFGDLYEIYLKNKYLINLNTEGVTLESAYFNEYNKYVRNNFHNIPRCVKRCSLNNITNNPVTGIIYD